jgi:hypothetical protein
MPGLGLGPPPGAPPPPGRGAPGRGAPGRGAAEPGRWAGRGGMGTPDVEPPPTPNGLLPGRGPGRGGSPGDPGAGRPAGGFGAGPGVGVALAGGAALAAGRSTCGADGRGAGVGVGAAGLIGSAGATSTGGAGVGADSAAGTAFAGGFLAGADFLAAFCGASDCGNASRSRRATGGSTVEDALLTNSPSSLSLARTTLLGTPSSLASSCTRALPATGLLVSRPAGHRSTSLASWTACSSLTLHCRLIRIDLPCRWDEHTRVGMSANYRGSLDPRTYSVSTDGSGGRATRTARANARRRSARSTHAMSRCTQAPRPGIRRRGSGTRTPSTTTTRSSSIAAARSRHPTQVRTGTVFTRATFRWRTRDSP